MRRWREECPPRTEAQRDVILQNADGNDAAVLFLLFVLISFKLHKYSAALEDGSGEFVSQHTFKFNTETQTQCGPFQ